MPSASLQDLKKTIGSLLILGFEGLRITDSLKNFLEQWDLGGVILFKRNIQSLDQLLELNRSIDEAATETPILSVDHEGGKVFRLPPPFTVFPPMRRVGDYGEKQGNWDLAYQVGQLFGRELRAAGLNVDYAPVLDVDSNPQNPIIGDRAFSRSPEQVAQAALAFLAGLQSEGVQGCGKHFPGHGDTVEDSHLTLPKVEKSQEKLKACELFPFRQAVLKKIPLLMTAHVVYPAFDDEWPATLSEKILKNLLREEMGYEGLILSDDFFMKGIAARWELPEAVERFFRAGGDLALLCHQEPVQKRVAAHLVHRAEQDSEFRERLEEKSRKVQAFRKRLASGIDGEKVPLIGCAQHQDLAGSLLETFAKKI